MGEVCQAKPQGELDLVGLNYFLDTSPVFCYYHSAERGGKMERAIYFDMDGTLADFYNQPNWLADLVAQKTDPYDKAEPLITKEQMETIVKTLKNRGYIVGIISWLSKASTNEYKEKVRQAKHNWLNKHFGQLFDEVHLVAYGTPKHKVAQVMPSVLVDDNQEINEAWAEHGGLAIDAKDITKILQIVT